jgi:membrane protease YdiL (CAAX protease family)
MYLGALIFIGFILYRLCRRRSLIPQSSPLPDIPWNFGKVVIVFIVIEFVQIFVIGTVTALTDIKVGEIVGKMLSPPIALAGLLIFFFNSSKFTIAFFGLNHHLWKLQILFGIRWASIYSISLFLLRFGTLGMDVEDFHRGGFFYEIQSGWGTWDGWKLLLSFFTTVFVAPILEELMFRGLLYTTIRKEISLWLSILITSFVFMLAHDVNAYGAFLISVFLCLLVEESGSLFPAIAAHITHNLLAEAKSIPFVLPIPFDTYIYFLLAGGFMIVIGTFLLEVWTRKCSGQTLTLDMVWSVPR